MSIEMDENQLLEKVALLGKKVKTQLDQKIIGQDLVVEQLLTALLANGHVLLVGVPGLAKTLLIKTLCESFGLQFGRIQFTPDLMPADITGADIIDEKESGKREFRFVKGPVFCNLLLADELNRTPPKTQAALLQAMQENAVTAGGKTLDLPYPFMVFATQNPIEQAGTYSLPEAQLDRFMFQINVSYPEAKDEIEIVRRTTVGINTEIKKVISKEELINIQKMVPKVPCADHILKSAVTLVRETRPTKDSKQQIQENVVWGAGPRAAQMLILAAKARTLLSGRFAVDINDIKVLAPTVLRHRLVLNFESESRGYNSDKIISELISSLLP